MMQLASNFLAARGDDDWVKFVIGGIAVAIWLLGSLAQAMSKKKEEHPTNAPDYRSPEEIERAQREEVQRRIQDLTGIQLPTPPPTHHRAPVPFQAKNPPIRKPIPPRKTKQRRPTPPPVQQQSAPVLPPAPAIAPAVPVAQASLQPKVAVNALTLHRWLNPDTLRQQFILTEILQKPIVLRPGHLDDV